MIYLWWLPLSLSFQCSISVCPAMGKSTTTSSTTPSKGQFPKFLLHCPWESTQSAAVQRGHYNLGKDHWRGSGPNATLWNPEKLIILKKLLVKTPGVQTPMLSLWVICTCLITHVLSHQEACNHVARGVNQLMCFSFLLRSFSLSPYPTLTPSHSF